MLVRMHVRLGVVAVILAAAVLHPALALAEDPCKSDGGSFVSSLVPPPECDSPVGICTRGALDGKFPETYYFVMDYLIPAGDPADPTKFVYGGHSVITRDNGGATLYGHDTGVLHLEGELNPFVTTVNVVGGTKEYNDATGQFVATGELNFVTGDAAGTFTSMICK